MSLKALSDGLAAITRGNLQALEAIQNRVTIAEVWKFKDIMATNDKKTNGSDVNTVELKKIDSALQKQAADVRHRIHAAVGQVVLALTVEPRYRHQSIADLQNLVPKHGQKKWKPVFRPAMRPRKITPLMRDRIAIATPAGSEGEDNPNSSRQDSGALAGIAFWATVSDEVDGKIREQIKGGSFPIRLKPDEWNSGDHVWNYGDMISFA
jgi:hemolysin-activating ACP:hemolysin acyltransferase